MKLHTSTCAMLLITLLLVACAPAQDSAQGLEWKFLRTNASEFSDDGWFFVFSYERVKEGVPEPADSYHYTFGAINLRYRFAPEYVVKTVRETNKKTYLESYAPGILYWFAGSDARKRDLELLETQILIQDRSVEEMLSLDPNDYEFEELDGDMFFRLMREALTGEKSKETAKMSYGDKPSFAMLIEPAYVDGYRFQMAYHLNGMGCIRETYIDVIYQTGPGYADYVQLSDLVEQGKADEKQQEAFALLQTIVHGLRETDDFLIGSEKYEKRVIGDIDFSRLYQFMKDVDENKYERYMEDIEVFSIEEISS